MHSPSSQHRNKGVAAPRTIRKTKKTTTWLSKVPTDVAENIFRQSSAHPNSTNWSSFLDLNCVQKMTMIADSFSTVGKHIVNDINITDSPGPSPEIAMLDISSEDSGHHISHFFTAFARSLKNVKISSGTFPRNLFHPLTTCCPNISALSLCLSFVSNHSIIEKTIEAIGPQLKTLELRLPGLTKSDTLAVSKFCTSLQDLKLNCEMYEFSMQQMWTQLGPSLTTLSISNNNTIQMYNNPNFTNIALSSIKASCKSLTALEVQFMPAAFRGELFSVTMALGHHLQYLVLKQCKYPTDFLAQTCARFPTLKIDLSERCGPSRDAVVAMGQCARGVTIGCRTQFAERFPSRPGLGQVSDKCRNLERIQVWCRSMSSRVINSFFLFPKPLLRDFRMTYQGERETATVLENLSKHVSALENFQLYDGICSWSSLRTFSENCKSLVKVFIENVPYCGFCTCISSTCAGRVYRYTSFGDAITILAQNGSIQYVRLSCDRSYKVPQCVRNEEFSAPCALARHKKISVYVCGYRYV